MRPASDRIEVFLFLLQPRILTKIVMSLQEVVVGTEQILSVRTIVFLLCGM